MHTQSAIPGMGSRDKPDGGYIQISTLALGSLWWAYTKGLLTLRAVRVGLALFELRIRRAAYIWTEKRRGNQVPDFIPRYSTKEVGDYCGLPDKRAKAALAELQSLGLVTEFTESRIAFASSLEALALSPEQRAEFRAWLATLTRRRRVPIPRRILALACESSAPALIAVILGVCLRCSWLRPGENFSFTGRIACSWLVRRFGISLRAVQQAKEHLVTLGWIERTGDINRFGERVAINPAWHRLVALPEIQGEKPKEDGAGEGDLPPDSAHPAPAVAADAPPAPLPDDGQSGTNSAGVSAWAGTNSAGVSLIRESLPSEEIKYQRESQAPERHPETSGLGISISQKEPEEKTTKANADSETLPPPRLSAIRAEDFQDIGRALELFRQAVKCGLAPNDSEHCRLLWMAAIERARTVPAQNPAGLFLFLVKNRQWDFLSDGHFDAAHARLKAYLYGDRRSEEPPLVVARPTPQRPTFSKDALLVQVVRNELGKRGIRCELFSVLRSQAGWDRARFEAALAELEGTPRESAVGCGLGLG
jgi:hypothetical protein